MPRPGVDSIILYPNKHERAELERKAAGLNMSLSKYILMVAVNAEVKITSTIQVQEGK